MNGSNPAVLNTLSRDTSAQSALSRVTSAMTDVRRELATQWMAMVPADVERHYGGRLGQIHRMISGINLRNRLPSHVDGAFITALKAALSDESPRQLSLGKLLAAFLFLFPHELPHRYDIDVIPLWLRNDYLRYMLIGPEMFREIGEAEAYLNYASWWTAYLHENVLANVNSELWRDVGLFFTQNANFIPLYFNNRNVRDLYRKRAAIMERTALSLNMRLDHVFGPRPKGRNRLRVGILAPHYGPGSETYATLPWYRYLDRARFEVVLYSLQQTNHPLEKFCASHADQFVLLTGDLTHRLQVLRTAHLDFILIGSNVTAVMNDIPLLALHRLARVQIASVCSCNTTGMRNVDYYLSGRLTEPPDAQSHYTERLIMLDGPASCFDFGDKPQAFPTEVMNRDVLAIADDAIVFASGANFFKILPELEETWIRILSAIPRSHLVLYPFNSNWSPAYPVDAFLERLSASMARHGLESGRLAVLGPVPERADVLQRLRLADIYLDSFPYGGATSLLDPLEVGLPIVAMDGETSRAVQGAALLRDMEMDELIVKDVDGYVALAMSLADDGGFRSRVRGRITNKMKDVPKFLDSKRYGEQVGLAFERMWKECGHGG
jgi:predicted O-linked N-acetylglucosamine transferase (SPINDLY family)